MGPIWALVTPDGPHVGPMNLAIREDETHNPDLQRLVAVAIKDIHPKKNINLHKISFACNLFLRCIIILQFYTDHGRATVALCAKWLNYSKLFYN